MRGQLNEVQFILNDDGSVYLNENGKRLFIQSFNEKLSSKISIDDKMITYENLIEREIRLYLKHLLDGSKYKPYKYY